MKKKIISLCVGLILITLGGYMLFNNLSSTEFSNANIPTDRQGFSEYYHSDYKKAFEKLLPMAEKGNINAQVSLGTLYSEGLGTRQNYKKAFNWYNKAAKQGSLDAIINLAIMYKHGNYVKKDIKKSIELYKQVIKRTNDSTAKYNLSLIYLNNLEYCNIKQGIKLLEEAANQNNSNAMRQLGTAYYAGDYGLPVDYRKAFKLIKSSADQGDSAGQNNLGIVYYDGKAVKKDNSKAYKWFYIASKYGNCGNATKFLNEFNFNLTNIEKDEAIKAAEEWIKTHKEINSEIINAD